MNKFLTVLASATVASLSLTNPAKAQTVEVCETIFDHIPPEKIFLYQDMGRNNDPAHIDGNTHGSRVNVRTGPGIKYEASAYGLVGDYVDVLGHAFSLECDTWAKVRFPVSGFEGWVHIDYINLTYGRGWWD